MYRVKQAASPGRFYKYLHAFRGFAIINVVAVHAMAMATLFARPPGATEPRPHPVADTVNELLLHDATMYFALISGLLYATVLKDRSWLHFFKGKLLNVICPYIVVSVVLTLFAWPVPFGPVELGWFQGSASEFLHLAGWNIVSGDSLVPMWYVPVLTILFLATPLIAFATARSGLRWMVVVLVLLPLVVSRQGWEVTPDTIIFFLGVYALGILVGHDLERWMSWARAHLLALGVVALVSTAVVFALNLAGIEFAGPVSLKESAFYVQKLALSGVALVLLQRWQAQLPKWLDSVAAYAFAIYFLHGPIQLAATVGLNRHLADYPNALDVLLISIAFIVLPILVSVAVAYSLRVILGKRSRMLIGA